MAANQARRGWPHDRRARIGFGAGNLAVAAFVAVGVFRLLPTRWWVVDGGAVVVSLLLGASGAAILARHRFAARLTRVASAVVLVLGLALFAAIALTASWISGVYAQVGKSGAIIFGLVAALVLPYVVVLPAVELAWVGPWARRSTGQPGAGSRAASAAAAVAEASADDDGDDGDEARRGSDVTSSSDSDAPQRGPGPARHGSSKKGRRKKRGR